MRVSPSKDFLLFPCFYSLPFLLSFFSTTRPDSSTEVTTLLGFIVVETEDSVVMVGGLPLDGALAQTKEVAAVGEGSQEKILVFYCEDS
jgi:hypothetical protein